MTEEEWKPVVGYEGLYEVSNLARVKRVFRVITRSDGVVRRFDENIRKLSVNKRGYSRLMLCKDGVLKNFELHRLIAEAFIPNPQNLPVVRNLNDVKSDNRIENLAWGTHKDNGADAVRNRQDRKRRGHGV